MNMLSGSARITAMVLMVGALCAGQAWANPATGTNSDLAGNPNIYIPLQPSTSGTLGDLLGGGPKIIGRSPDSIVLNGNGASSSGWLDLVINFDISDELSGLPGSIITSGVLTMIFDDLDFRPFTTPGRAVYAESVDMAIFVSVLPLGTPLTVDDTNYDNPDFNATLLPSNTPAGADFDTNNQKVSYEFDMANHFGLSPADFAIISANGGFDLHLRLHAMVDHLRVAPDRVNNSSETVDEGDFQFNAVPEPGTISLLALGSLFVAARKVRRRARHVA